MSSEDKTLVEITIRHHQDAIWFDSGLHDANGYVAMAHKDRGELLSRLRQLRTGEKADPASPGEDPPGIVIPHGAYLWLMGEGPDDQGKHFGDDLLNQQKVPTYWWRSIFRRMCGFSDKTKAAA